MSSVTVLIVNYRAADLILANLPNITAERQGVGKLDVVIVDNHSEDGSVETLQAAIEESRREDITLIASDVNGGFAAGNNIGFAAVEARESLPDAILLLNPDTQLGEGSIGSLMKAAEDHPKAGILGGKAFDENGAPRGCAYRFPTLTRELAILPLISKVFPRRLREVGIEAGNEETVRCDWVSGACMMITRKAFASMPRFDQRYFLYFEETDYCLGARRKGIDVLHVPAARYVHIKGASTGVGAAGDDRPLPDYWYRSYRRFYVQNYGRSYGLAVWFVRITHIWLDRIRGHRHGPTAPTARSIREFCVRPTLKGEPLS